MFNLLRRCHLNIVATKLMQTPRSGTLHPANSLTHSPSLAMLKQSLPNLPHRKRNQTKTTPLAHSLACSSLIAPLVPVKTTASDPRRSAKPSLPQSPHPNPTNPLKRTPLHLSLSLPLPSPNQTLQSSKSTPMNPSPTSPPVSTPPSLSPQSQSPPPSPARKILPFRR